MLRLYSRLAGHRVGQVDWDKYMPELYTRFMASFNLPVTYGGSGVHIKHGISGSSCLGSITKWIVSTLGGRSSSQTHLSSLLGAIQSYYHPANSNNSSELLHVLISGLCTYFVDRVHLERHNKKWVTKIPPDKRLTNQDIDMFVMSVRALELLYSLLPGIDVNDIWKCTDILVLMSDLLEMMPVTDLSKGTMTGLTDVQMELVQKIRGFENFVVEFMNRLKTAGERISVVMVETMRNF